MGSVEKNILEQCYRSRMPVPPRILNAPELHLGLELYYAGFLDLNSCRSFGFAEGPISWITIVNYCDYKGLTEEQTEDFIFHIGQMDTAYLKYRASKVESGK
jgi:hypothetical protein